MRCCPLFLLLFALPSLAADTSGLEKSFTVTPAAEPRPALSIVLLPPLKEKVHEDASAAYFRTFLDMPKPDSDPQRAQAAAEELDTWLKKTPVDELPKEQVRKRLAEYQKVFKELERAARCTYCDWGTLPRLKEDGIATLLQEAQPAREVATWLALRCKFEIAERRFDDAERSLRSGFLIAQHVGESPTLIQLLVGLAIENMFLERIEEWIATPGSPNLYWALTALPRPLINPRIAFEGEGLVLEALIPDLAKLRAGPLSHEESRRVVEEMLKKLSRLDTAIFRDSPDKPIQESITNLGITGYILWHYPSAKSELIQRGWTKEEVEKLGGAQTVFVNSYERYRELRDSLWKWFYQPYHLALPKFLDLFGHNRSQLSKYKADVFFQILTLPLAASDRVYEAVARSERRVAGLRTVEAIRIYAVANQGNPPTKLADCTVPVPDDPFTGKPFKYMSQKTGFTLSGSPPAENRPMHRNNFTYTITIKP